MKTIYTNGNIITLENTYPNALVEENGIIISVGEFKDIYQEDMQVVDLKGKTLIPSFIDSHSHLSGYAMGLLQVSLDQCQSVKDIQDEIKQYIDNHHIKDGEFVMCKGYDHHLLKEKRHIHKQELDSVSTHIPIVVQHQTGHCGVMNSAALQKVDINEKTKSPEGGFIDYQKGFLEETGFTIYLQKVPMRTLEELKKAYQDAQNQYASYGITTLQEGMIVEGLLDIYKMLIHDQQFFLDIVGYPGFESTKFIDSFQEHIQAYKHHFKIGGYKMFLDGSPQNKTAWTIDPYLDGTYGYPTLTDEQIKNNLEKAIHQNMQVLAHCNGDQAIQHYIEQYEIVKKHDIRPVIVHAQMMREEQMDKAKQLQMIPSFFLAHVYYFGDIHKENMGIKRAQSISPLNTALKHNLLFTLHQDAPVIEPNMIETMHIAVNRETLSGDILGNKECISPMDALKALTINGAYQYHEENEKGSLKVGKKADMVILSDNPLTIDKKHIKDIQIITTIKDGKIIYKR